MFISPEDIINYIGGCSLQRGATLSTPGDTMMSVGGYHEYTKGCSVHGRDTMMNMRDTMMNVGYTMMSMMVYHEYTGICSLHRGFHANSIVSPMTFPHIYHDIPLVYS